MFFMNTFLVVAEVASEDCQLVEQQMESLTMKTNYKIARKYIKNEALNESGLVLSKTKSSS